MNWSNRWAWIGFGILGIFILTVIMLIINKLCHRFTDFKLNHVSSTESLMSLNSNIEINIIKSTGEIEMVSIHPIKTLEESINILQHQRSRRITNI
jgi:hypothetical protein